MAPATKKNHRVELNRVGISTVLDVEDTVSHSFELHRYSPVLHPLLSEIMMGDESGCWTPVQQQQSWPLHHAPLTVHGL